MDKIKKLSLGLTATLVAALVFLAGCLAPPEGTEGTGGFDWTIIAFLVAIFALMYFVMIRPQRKRQKEHQAMVSELKRGDKVITAGGIYGVIESVSEDSVVIKVESGVLLRVVKQSVSIRKD
jgi:preprotein translocase subunit YajC